MTNNKTTAVAKLINTLSSTTGLTDLNASDIILATFGYTPEDITGNHPVKNLTYRLRSMATPEQFNTLIMMMRMGNFEESIEDSPALINYQSGDEVLSQFTNKDLTARINKLLNAAVIDRVAIDQLREAYTIAAYLRKKRIKMIVIGTVVTGVAVAAIGTGAFMLFGSKHEDAPATTDPTTDDDVIVDDPVVVIVDEDPVDYGDMATPTVETNDTAAMRL